MEPKNGKLHLLSRESQMRPSTEYHDARRMMIELFRLPDDGPVVGVDNLIDHEREFMKATCATTVLLYTLCHMAGLDAEEAKQGLKCLELEKHINEICDLPGCIGG
jgi:hypothetical protein